MSRRRDSLLVLGIVGQYPMAGVAWQAIHYLLGFRELGWDVWYVEDSGAPPYDPRVGGVSGECDYAVKYIRDVMTTVGLGDRWVYLDMMKNETHGLSAAHLQELYGSAAAIVNVCGATAPREEHKRSGKLIYVETDPLIYAPDSYSWWDVPVSEVSTLESTQTAHERYADWKKVQRPLINPSDR